MRLEDKTAIVTGASRGIGRAIALKLGAMNASVAVNYVNDEKAAAATVSGVDWRRISRPAPGSGSRLPMARKPKVTARTEYSFIVTSNSVLISFV